LAINPENNAAPFPVVGIGASAGGLRALENFFQPKLMKAETNTRVADQAGTQGESTVA